MTGEFLVQEMIRLKTEIRKAREELNTLIRQAKNRVKRGHLDVFDVAQADRFQCTMFLRDSGLCPSLKEAQVRVNKLMGGPAKPEETQKSLERLHGRG